MRLAFPVEGEYDDSVIFNTLRKKAEEYGVRVEIAELYASDESWSIEELEEAGVIPDPEPQEKAVEAAPEENINDLLILISSLMGASIDVADLARRTGENSPTRRGAIIGTLAPLVEAGALVRHGDRYSTP